MSNLIHHELARQHQQELLRQAQHLMVVKNIQAARPTPTRRYFKVSRSFYAPTLARFGNWLVHCGAFLQTRYAETHTSQNLISLEN